MHWSCTGKLNFMKWKPSTFICKWFKGSLSPCVPQPSPGGEGSGGSGVPRQVPAVQRGDGHSARCPGRSHHRGNACIMRFNEKNHRAGVLSSSAAPNVGHTVPFVALLSASSAGGVGWWSRSTNEPPSQVMSSWMRMRWSINRNSKCLLEPRVQLKAFAIDVLL